MAPALGLMSVASIASSVDFPAPLGPRRPTMAPRAATKETASHGATPPEVTGDIVNRHLVEVEHRAHAATPSPPPPSGPAVTSSNSP